MFCNAKYRGGGRRQEGFKKCFFGFNNILLYNKGVNFSELNIEMVFALMSGKLSAAINRKLYRSFRKLSIDITPEQWTVLYYLWSRDGVTQQELCNVTFKD